MSAGGTGTFDIAGSWPDVTEVQAGSYVFMDGAYRNVRPDLGRPALTLLATVISRRGERAIIDAGMKSLTNEFGPPMVKGTDDQGSGGCPRSMGILRRARAVSSLDRKSR